MNSKDIQKGGSELPVKNGADKATEGKAPVSGAVSAPPHAVAGTGYAASQTSPMAVLASVSAKAAFLRLNKHREDEDEDEQKLADDVQGDEVPADDTAASSVDAGSVAAGEGEIADDGELADADQALESEGRLTSDLGGASDGFLPALPPGAYILGAAALLGGGIAIFSGGGGGKKIAAPAAMLKSDTGPSASDFITSDGTVDVSGVVSGNSWEYSTDSGKTWKAGSGASFTLDEGTYAAGSVQVRQKNPDGDVGEVGKIGSAITVDHTAPDAPTIGTVAQDDIVDLAETGAAVAVSGTGEAGSALSVTWGETTKTVTVGADGAWSVEFAAAEIPADGTYDISAMTVDKAGNTSATATHEVTVDRQSYIIGMVSAGPVTAGLEVKAFTEDGTLLASGLTDETGSFRIGFTDYTGLVLVSVVDPQADARGFLDEATGEQSDLTVMLRAVRAVQPGEDVVVNISPLTEVATRLMSPELNATGVTTLGDVAEADVVNANALVAKLFTDQPDINLTMQDLKLVIDASGADTSADASVYGVYLAAIQGWTLQEQQTLEETIEEIVALLNGSQSSGGGITRAELGVEKATALAAILQEGFATVVAENDNLSAAQLPTSTLKTLGFINDETGPSFEAGTTVTKNVAEDAQSGQVVYTSTASDPSGGVTYALEAGTPFAINAQTGAISLTGALDFEGQSSYELHVSATDFWGNVTNQTVTVAVTNVNEAPVLSQSLADQTAVVGQAFSYAIAAGSFTDPDAGTTLTYAATLADGTALPSWLSFDGQTGTFSASNPPSLATPLAVKVTASDGSLTVSDEFALSTVSAPQIASITADSAAANQGDTVTLTVTFSEAVTLTGNASEVVLSFAGGTFTATGVSQSQPNQMTFTGTVPAGDFTQVTLGTISLGSATLISQTSGEGLLTDVTGQAIADFVIDNTAPTITSTSLSAAENGTAVGQLTASEAVTWTLNGSTGAQFSLTPSGVLSLVEAQDYETDAHSYSVSVIATDSAGNASAQTVTVALTNVNEAPVLSQPLTDQTAVVGQAFSYAIAAGSFTDPDADTTLTYAATLADGTALPSWLSFDGQTGTFSASNPPSLATPLTVKVTASDGSLTVSDEFALSTLSAPQIAAITADSVAANQGDMVTLTVTFSEAVTLTGNASEVVLSFAGGTFTATGVSQSQPNQMTFTGTVPAGDFTQITLGSISLGSATLIGQTSGEGLLTDQVGQTVANFVIDNTAPTITSASVSVAENTTAAIQLTASEGVTWALDGSGGDNALFALGSTGALSLLAPKNYETDAHSYSVAVTATDSAGNVANQTVTVALTNVNEAPVMSQALVDQSVVVGQAFSYAIAGGSFTDPDAGTTLTYTATLSNGSPLPGWLSFDAQTGTFSAGSTPELASPLTVRVTASDGTLNVSDDFTLSTVSAPSFTTAANGVTNLDVRSNLVLVASEDIALTTIDGNYEILVSNDANGGGKTGYSGNLGESADHTQSISITVSGGMATATLNGNAVTLSEVLTIDGDRLIINPVFDLDFANNYHLEIDAGLFVGATSGQGNVELGAAGATFATVTPNTVGSGAALVSGASASQTMNDDGSLAASHKWLGIDNVGNTAVAAPTDLGSLAADGYALVATDRNPDPANPPSSLGIGTWDFWVRAANFGSDDLIYIDNQQLDVAGQWDLDNTYFADADYGGDYYSRLEFDTSDGGTGTLPSSSQAWLDFYVDGQYYVQPSEIQDSFGTTEPVFVGG